MGQPIQIHKKTVTGDIAGFDTDRAITGQDGVGFGDASVATDAGSISGDLAARLFQADAEIDHVFVASNQVVARRHGGWNDQALDRASGVVSAFFVFYAS